MAALSQWSNDQNLNFVLCGRSKGKNFFLLPHSSDSVIIIS